VSDITTTTADPRADGLVAAVRASGFAIHRHEGVDDIEAFLSGVRAIRPGLVVVCARGASDPQLVRPFVLAIPDIEYILVAGDIPDPTLEREGDPGSAGYYLDPVASPDEVPRVMAFISRGLGILPPPVSHSALTH
jgi:hypothetical protein